MNKLLVAVIAALLLVAAVPSIARRAVFGVRCWEACRAEDLDSGVNPLNENNECKCIHPMPRGEAP